MSTVVYPAQSAYAATPQSSNYIGIFVPRTIQASFDDTPYTIEPKYNHRPDLLANDLYGNPSYYWVFCMRNPDIIRDVTWDFVTGAVITLPSATNVKATYG